jgi:hypothetical protein
MGQSQSHWFQERGQSLSSRWIEQRHRFELKRWASYRFKEVRNRIPSSGPETDASRCMIREVTS